jgi:hypothetical protein
MILDCEMMPRLILLVQQHNQKVGEMFSKRGSRRGEQKTMSSRWLSLPFSMIFDDFRALLALPALEAPAEIRRFRGSGFGAPAEGPKSGGVQKKKRVSIV